MMANTEHPFARGTTSRLSLVPIMTLVFLGASTWSLFDWQSRDQAWRDEAISFYSTSGLERLEVPRYDSYLQDSDSADAVPRLHALRQLRPGDPQRARLVLDDVAFVSALHADRIITRDDPVFNDWAMQRRSFERLAGRTSAERFGVARDRLLPAWRWLTYAVLQGGVASWAAAMLGLALLGWALETILGGVRFAASCLVAALAAAALHVLSSGTLLMGSRLPLALLVGLLWRFCLEAWVPASWPAWLARGQGRILVATLASAAWGLTWLVAPDQGSGATAPGIADGIDAALLGALGFATARRFHARPQVRQAPAALGRGQEDLSARTAREARDAAARLDVLRAIGLYRQLLETDPKRIDYLAGYLNVSLLGSNDEVVRDCALRILWLKFPAPTDELRRVFLQLSQPKVLRLLPIDEHLRLARRLVKLREDSAALRLIDAILEDASLRDTYARQTADCLLGIFTTYTRLGLTRQAAQIQHRLTIHYPQGTPLGGVEKSSLPPADVLNALRGRKKPRHREVKT